MAVMQNPLGYMECFMSAHTVAATCCVILGGIQFNGRWGHLREGNQAHTNWRILCLEGSRQSQQRSLIRVNGFSCMDCCRSACEQAQTHYGTRCRIFLLGD